jgi:hypothetical protein
VGAAAGGATGSEASAKIAALTEGAVKAMAMNRLKLGTRALWMIGVP